MSTSPSTQPQGANRPDPPQMSGEAISDGSFMLAYTIVMLLLTPLLVYVVL